MSCLLGVYEKSMPDSFTLWQKLSAAGNAGFDFMEISIDESDEKLCRLSWSADQRHELAAAIRDTGVPILSMCLSGHRRYPLGSESPQVAAQALELLKYAVDFASEMGIRVIQLAGYDEYYHESNQITRTNFEKNLLKGVEFACAHCVMLAFETMETPFMDTVSKAQHYVGLVHSPFLQIYPDIGNLTNAARFYGHDVVEDLRAGSGHLAMAHLKEAKADVYRDLFYGDGCVDFQYCIDFLKSDGVRMFVGEFWHCKGQDPAQHLLNANCFLRPYLLP